MTKNPLCQEKSAFRKLIAVNDSGLERGENMVRISLVYGIALGKGFQQLKNL
jgi:hypothetical protein